MRVKLKIRKSRHSSHNHNLSSKICRAKIKPKLWRGGIKMNAVMKSISEEDVQLTCLTEISKIVQSAIKAKGLTSEEVDKSFGLVRKHNVKRKN